MRLHIASLTSPGSGSVLASFGGATLMLEEGAPDFDISLPGDRRLLIFGEVFYHLSSKGLRVIEATDRDYLAGVFAEGNLREIVSTLEGTYIGVLVEGDSAVVFQDRYARRDLFFARAGADVHFSADIDTLARFVKPEHDQLMLAHMFLVYGWYAPKGRTLYSNIDQLKVGQVARISGAGVGFDTLVPFEPLEIAEYGPDDLERYHDALRSSVFSRAERGGKTWVSASSGWDSSMLVGMLRSELDADKVGMIAGSMHYSPQTDVINQFEMTKIGKVGEYFGIKPEVVEFDFVKETSADWWASVLPFFRSRHVYSLTSFNFGRISQGLAAAAGPGSTIFNGETSDSFHNFGFSQFVTFFHTEKPFTEYGDKMNCWLYSPAFFSKVLDGSYEKDKVWQIFQKMYGPDCMPAPADRRDLVEAYLFPLFYGGPRIPLAKTSANPALTASGQGEVYRYPFRSYMPEVLDGVTPETLYAWYIRLYHSFHSQGSTVNVQKHAMEMNDHGWRQPYNDYRLIDILSAAPTSWGRGLDFNHTKYPLKWVAQNRIDFPYETLDQGPHSYLYDVIEGFSLLAEIMYRSGVTPMFKQTLAEKPYRDLLDDTYVDVAYLDRIVDDYLAGKEASGADFNNLVSLATLCVTGWL